LKWMTKLKSLTWSTGKWAPMVTAGPLCGAIGPKLPESCDKVLFYVGYERSWSESPS
jgi:hypothetical protein